MIPMAVTVSMRMETHSAIRIAANGMYSSAMPRVAEAKPKAKNSNQYQQGRGIAESFDHAREESVYCSGFTHHCQGAANDQHKEDDPLGIGQGPRDHGKQCQWRQDRGVLEHLVGARNHDVTSGFVLLGFELPGR